MGVIDCQIEIDAPRDYVFAVSQDTAARCLWDVFTRSIRYSARQPGHGVSAIVRARKGLGMTVRFIKYDAPERAAIVMTEGPWFIQRFAGSWEFRRQGSENCHVRFRYALALLPWLTRPGLERLVIRIFARDINARLVGLKRYCEAHY